MTQHDTAATASSLALLLNGAAGHAAQAAELLAGCALTVDRWRALELATRQPGLTMSGLATELGMPSSTATRIVDHLVADGVLHRVVDSADRRRVVLKVTDRGLTVASQARHYLEPLEIYLRVRIEGTQINPSTDDGADQLARHLVDEGRVRETASPA